MPNDISPEHYERLSRSIAEVLLHETAHAELAYRSTFNDLGRHVRWVKIESEPSKRYTVKRVIKHVEKGK